MWRSKQKVAADGAPAAMKLDVRSARKNRREGKRGDEARKLREFFRTLGTAVESLIDATPLGVPDPVAPWDETDRTKALLSNPVGVLRTVSETIDALSPAQLLGKAEGSAWMLASSRMLVSLRQGLAHAVLAEEKLGGCCAESEAEEPVVVEREADATVPGEAGPFVDLGADRWGNSKRSAKPVQEALAEAKALRKVTVSKILAFIDNMTLRANGIVVTSDDCSVECSLASLVDDSDFEACSPVPGCISSDEDDFEDCPSVVTEIAVDELEDTAGEDTTGEDTEAVQVTKEDVVEKEDAQESKADLVSDEEEYVMTEEPDSEDEDFVDVRADLDIEYNP